MNEEKILRSSFVKSKLLQYSNGAIAFDSKPGLEDIVFSNSISITFFARKLYDYDVKYGHKIHDDNFASGDSDDEMSDAEVPLHKTNLNEKLILHQAAQIIRDEISKISEAEYFPESNQLSLEFSKTFVPEYLQHLISWIMCTKAFSNVLVISDGCKVDKRRMLALCECLIFCTRINKKSVIPPAHYGLAIELHHNYGSRTLIDTLNSYGFCCNYDELRKFLTAHSNAELEKKPRCLRTNRTYSQKFWR